MAKHLPFLYYTHSHNFLSCPAALENLGLLLHFFFFSKYLQVLRIFYLSDILGIQWGIQDRSKILSLLECYQLEIYYSSVVGWALRLKDPNINETRFWPWLVQGCIFCSQHVLLRYTYIYRETSKQLFTCFCMTEKIFYCILCRYSISDLQKDKVFKLLVYFS